MAQRLSTWVALRCREADFQRFLGVTSEQEAADKVRTMCGVASRAEFDTDPAAEQRLHKIIRLPYIIFTQDQEQQHDKEQHRIEA